MLRSTVVCILSALLATSVSAQDKAGVKTAVSPTAKDRAALVQYEEGWTKAVVARDRAYFNRTLAPGFVYTEDDRMMTREALIKELLTGSDVTTAAHNEGMLVHIFGPTAVVTGILVVNGRNKSGAFERRYRFTDTWAKSADGTWQMVAAQDYLIPAKR